MRRLVLALVFLVVIAGAAIALLPYSGKADLPAWRTAAVERGEIVATVAASGTLNAVVLVEVGSQVSGQIQDLFADFNSPVRQGDVIARIDPEIFEAKVQQAEAELEVAEASVAVQRAQVQRAAADTDNARAGLDVAKAQIERAQIALEDAKRDLERKRPLVGSGVISASEWDKTQSAHQSALSLLVTARAQELSQLSAIRSAEAADKMAQAQLLNNLAAVKQKAAALRQARIDLERTYIRAPVDGIVVNRSVNRGQTVAASLQAPTLFTIAQDLSRMQVESSVVEADVGRVAVGQPVSFTVDAHPSRSFTGAVVEIRKAPQVVQNVVTYIVVVSADNAEQLLLPGMTANLRIQVDRKPDALKVQNAALRWRPAEMPADDARKARPAASGPASTKPAVGVPGRVFVAGEDGKPRAVALRIGITDGTSSEILAGEIAQGQAVITGAPPPPPPGRGFGLPKLF